MKRLLLKHVVRQLSLEDSVKANFHLYEAGKEASYFSLILEGCVEVVVGKDGLTFESRSFSHFGYQALLGAIQDPQFTYIPDYTVRITTDCTVIIVTKRQYLAALQASHFETGQSDSNQVQLQIENDMFSKEWDIAENRDIETSHSTASGLSSITKLFRKKQLPRNPPLKHPTHQQPLLTESTSESIEASGSSYSHNPLVELDSVPLEQRNIWLSLPSENPLDEKQSRANVLESSLSACPLIGMHASPSPARPARSSDTIIQDFIRLDSTEV